MGGVRPEWVGIVLECDVMKLCCGCRTVQSRGRVTAARLICGHRACVVADWGETRHVSSILFLLMTKSCNWV